MQSYSRHIVQNILVLVDDEFKGHIYEMARNAVKLEDRFIDLAYKLGDIEGLGEKK